MWCGGCFCACWSCCRWLCAGRQGLFPQKGLGLRCYFGFGFALPLVPGSGCRGPRSFASSFVGGARPVEFPSCLFFALPFVLGIVGLLADVCGVFCHFLVSPLVSVPSFFVFVVAVVQSFASMEQSAVGTVFVVGWSYSVLEVESLEAWRVDLIDGDRR